MNLLGSYYVTLTDLTTSKKLLDYTYPSYSWYRFKSDLIASIYATHHDDAQNIISRFKVMPYSPKGDYIVSYPTLRLKINKI